jgi:hypothetical protein
VLGTIIIAPRIIVQVDRVLVSLVRTIMVDVLGIVVVTHFLPVIIVRVRVPGTIMARIVTPVVRRAPASV